MKFRFFRKPEQYSSTVQNPLAAKIARRILHLQRWIAAIFNRRTASLSPIQWRCLIVLYCLAFSSYCLWLLLRPFLNL